MFLFFDFFLYHIGNHSTIYTSLTHFIYKKIPNIRYKHSGLYVFYVKTL